jgi:hypothetical protein
VGAWLADPPEEFHTVISAGAVVTFFTLPDHTPLLTDMETIAPESKLKLSVLLGILVVACTFTT